MASNKLPSNLTEEDLINLLNNDNSSQKSDKNQNNLPTVLQFLAVFEIKPGKNPIKSTGLYKLFKKWAGHTEYTQNQFTLEVGQYIEHTRKGFFLIDQDTFKISQRILHQINQKKPKRNLTVNKLKEHLDKFIIDNNLKRGNNWIDLEEFHKFYWTWAYKTKKAKRIYFNDFCKVIKLYFEVKKDQNNKLVIGIAKNEEK